MNKVYMLGATVLTSMVFAVSIASPAFAHYSNDETNKSGRYNSDDRDSDDDNDNESKKDHGHKSKKYAKDSSSDSDKDKKKSYSHKNDKKNDGDKHETKKYEDKDGKDDDDKKQHTDCHVKVSPNYNKYPSKEHCKKAEKKKSAVKPAEKQVDKTVSASSDQSKSTVLPNTGGASNIALAIGALVAAAAYCANMLRLKLRTDQ